MPGEQLGTGQECDATADVFSAGCVIAELFMEGKALFDLSQLLAYRRGEYDPSEALNKIEDEDWRALILHMISLDPNSRLTAVEYLRFPNIFPEFFEAFHGEIPIFICFIKKHV